MSKVFRQIRIKSSNNNSVTGAPAHLERDDGVYPTTLQDLKKPSEPKQGCSWCRRAFTLNCYFCRTFQLGPLGEARKERGELPVTDEAVSWGDGKAAWDSQDPSPTSAQGRGAGRCHCHNAPFYAVTSCSKSSGEGNVPDSQQLPWSLGLTWSKMGQFLSSTYLEGSPATVWPEKPGDGDLGGAGETVPVLQGQVMYWEERKLSLQHRVRCTLLGVAP